jgi:hypothetical protein
LKVIGAVVARATFFDDDDVQVSIEAPGFPKQMDGEKRTGRSTADDDNVIAVLKLPGLN